MNTHDPPQLVSEKEINELNAIEVEKDVALAERDLLGKNLNLVGNQIAKLIDDPTQQEQLQSLLERRSKIILEITVLFDRLKRLMRRERELRKMIKHALAPAHPMQMPTVHNENNVNMAQQLDKQRGHEISPPGGHVQMLAKNQIEMPENNENVLDSPINHSNVQVREEIHYVPNEQNGHANISTDDPNNNGQQVHPRARETFMESQLQMVLAKLNEKHSEKAHLISTKNGNDLEILLQQIHKLQEQAAAIERRIYLERGLLPSYPENTNIVGCGPAFGQCFLCDEILCKVYNTGCKWDETNAYCAFQPNV